MTVCLYCDNEIVITKKHHAYNKFCNSSCAAKYNLRGRPRTEESKNKTALTLLSRSLNSIHSSPYRVRSICINCGKAFYPKGSVGTYCTVQCRRHYQWNSIMVPKILRGEVTKPKTLKKYLTDTHGYRCHRCHISEWDGEKLVLQLDHIDGNSDNNFPSNLRLLCPNCHSLTPTYKGNGKNKNQLKDTKRNRLHRAIYARTARLLT